MCPYIALTRESAKNIMWDILQEIDDRFKIGVRFTVANLTATLPNDGRIQLFGADMKNFIKRLKGIKTPGAAIDEAQDFGPHIGSLVDDVLTPTISDFTDGWLALTGTPGPVPSGLFYEITEQQKHGYSVHKWSLYDNPYMPDPRGFVEDLKRRKGWTDQNPTYLREWQGIWVLDLDALVYKFRRDRNMYRKLPEGHEWLRIMTIDYGWNDQTAFGITTYSNTWRESYTEYVEGHSELIPSQIAERVNQLRERFNPYIIAADTGGLGKSITEEMIRRYHIPIQAAEKKEKLTAISIMNGDFIDQRHWIHESLGPLHTQYETLRKGENHLEDPGLPNDLCDVSLYGHRLAKHYLGEIHEPLPKTPEEAGKREAERILKADLEAFEDEKSRPWWDAA